MVLLLQLLAQQEHGIHTPDLKLKVIASLAQQDHTVLEEVHQFLETVLQAIGALLALTLPLPILELLSQSHHP